MGLSRPPALPPEGAVIATGGLAAIVAALGEGEQVQFRLAYRGRLPADGGKKPLELKHEIREQLHPQLQDLCARTPALLRLVAGMIGEVPRKNYNRFPELQTLYDQTNPDLSAIAAKYHFGEFQFVPIVLGAMKMVCELDILFLRRERPGSLMSKPKDEYGGDLDNRLKILLDALRLPREAKEVPPGARPTAHQTPFLCLLEDDSLITRFQVESDTLLGGEPGDPKDVDLAIKVMTRFTESSLANLGMIF